jgi:hypothetical protein
MLIFTIKKATMKILPSYKVRHDKVYSKDTQEIIDASNKQNRTSLPKKPNVWSDQEWRHYLLGKQNSFNHLLAVELSGIPESENYLRAAEYRDHLKEISEALAIIQK